jgi:hypothetical protein
MRDEDGLAEHVTVMLMGLSRRAEIARLSDEGFHEPWAEPTAAREDVQKKRQRLIKSEKEIYSVL